LTRASSDLQGELIPLEQFQDWDRHIAAYPQKRIFHESAWLKFLALDHRGEAKVLRVTTRSGEERALWPGLVVRKGPVRIFGSPLRGWGTPVMGPLFHDADASTLLPSAEAVPAYPRDALDQPADAEWRVTRAMTVVVECSEGMSSAIQVPIDCASRP
jgi:hypothetical protein